MRLVVLFCAPVAFIGCGSAAPDIQTPEVATTTAAESESQSGKVRVKAHAAAARGSDSNEGEATVVQAEKPVAKADVAVDDVAQPESIGDIVARLDDAVVFITVEDALGNPVAVGTGCIIDRSGLIATNYHVVEDAVNVTVKLRDGSEHDVTGYRCVEQSRDLAILQVDGLPDSATEFELQQPPELRQGDRLIAISHPQDFDFSVSDGILSALRTTEQLPEIYQQGLHSSLDTEWLQSTAKISNGSSGGPLLSDGGQLVGINTWVANGQNLSFAISVTHLIDLQNELQAVQSFPLPGSSVISSANVALLEQDYLRELQNLYSNLQSARSREDVRETIAKQNPVPLYLSKCAELVATDPTSAEAVDAILLAHTIWTTSDEQLEAGRRHLNRIHDSATAITDEAALSRIISSIRGVPYSKSLDHFLRTHFENGPTEEICAEAGFELFAAMSADPQAYRYTPEMIDTLTRLKENRGRIKIHQTPLSELSQEYLTSYQSLQIGAQAGDIEGKDLDGETFRLSDYSGKVVVLDFWADWCPHCRTMYSHERELVERLQDEPFALLGVNCDAAPDRPLELKESGQVTWRSWYNGDDGAITSDWQVSGFPTIYVLDKDHNIRFNGPRGEELDAAVDSLLEEDLIRFPSDVLATDADWSYLSGNDPPPQNWAASDFDDSMWPTGAGPLGFGTGVTTELPRSRSVATWFRTSFDVANQDHADRLFLTMKCDDGAVVYLNGNEVYRTNLTDDAGPETLATQHSAGAAHYMAIDPAIVASDRNILAVEVHQADPWRADLLLRLTISSSLPDAEQALAAKSP